MKRLTNHVLSNGGGRCVDFRPTWNQCTPFSALGLQGYQTWKVGSGTSAHLTNLYLSSIYFDFKAPPAFGTPAKAAPEPSPALSTLLATTLFLDFGSSTLSPGSAGGNRAHTASPEVSDLLEQVASALICSRVF